MKIGICKKCKKLTEIKAKGLCKKCYYAEYYRKNKERIKEHKKRYLEKKKKHTCPICGGYKEENEEVCLICKKKLKILKNLNSKEN